MEATIILVVIAIALFVASYASKKRFGSLGLALAAGSLLSGIWNYDAELIANCLGIPSGSITSAIIAAIILLLPAGVLMFHGKTYKSIIPRVVGACLFTILAFVLLIEPLSSVIAPTGVGGDVYNLLTSYKSLVISVGLVLAIVDSFLTKSSVDKKRKH